MLSVCCRIIHWSDASNPLLPNYISPSRHDFSLQLNLFSSAPSVVFKCFMHTLSSLWKPYKCYLLFMPPELPLIILWQCLEGLNKIRAMSARHCPSKVAASKASIQYFWVRDMSSVQTLVRPVHVWMPFPTSTPLFPIEKKVWCKGHIEAVTWSSQDSIHVTEGNDIDLPQQGCARQLQCS